jgi:hypothetical protein
MGAPRRRQAPSLHAVPLTSLDGQPSTPPDPDRELDEDYRRFEERIERLEREIAKKDRGQLAVLARAGIDREKVLLLLALAADDPGNKCWAEHMRNERDRLRSVAGRMETIVRDAKKCAANPFSRLSTWAFFVAGAAVGMKWPKPWTEDPTVRFIVAGMPVLAKLLRQEAERFGQFLRASSRRELGVVLLLLRVCISNPKHNCFQELALLLTEAYEVAGRHKVFSADGLRATWKRHGRLMLRIWYKLNAPAPESAPLPASLPRSIAGPIFELPTKLDKPNP